MRLERSVRMVGSVSPEGATYGAYFVRSISGSVASHGGSLAFCVHPAAGSIAFGSSSNDR
jgi:hypothetical protein